MKLFIFCLILLGALKCHAQCLSGFELNSTRNYCIKSELYTEDKERIEYIEDCIEEIELQYSDENISADEIEEMKKECNTEF